MCAPRMSNCESTVLLLYLTFISCFFNVYIHIYIFFLIFSISSALLCIISSDLLHTYIHT